MEVADPILRFWGNDTVQFRSNFRFTAIAAE
jgi:hypothetical protein